MDSFYIGMRKIYSDFNTDSANLYLKYGWQEHKNKIETLVSNSLNTLQYNKLSRALILGAGNCFDIPLDLICNNFNKVYLVDIDKQSLIKAKGKCNNETTKKVKLINNDISGFNQTLMPSFFNLIRNGKYNKAISLLSDSRWREHCILPSIGNKKFDLVISSCLLSQMASVWLILLKTMKEEGIVQGNISLFEKLLCHFCNNVLLPKHLLLLNRYCLPNGRIVLISDTLSWGYDGNIESPLNKLFDNPKCITMGDLLREDLVNYRLVGTFPIELLVNEFVNVEQQDNWLWNFKIDEERPKIYFVLGFVGSPKYPK